LNKPKVSIITVCYNSGKTIRDTLQSVAGQMYENIEHLVIDGLSSDDTMDIVSSFKHEKMKVISEKDHGLYDALNKGLQLASGDIIGILHSDDFFAHPHVIYDIVALFDSKENVQAISSSVQIYKGNDFKKPFRVYKANRFKLWQFRLGMQPPHPGFFIRKASSAEVGKFNTAYKISADFDWLLRAIRLHKLKVLYVGYVSVHMRDGGASSSGIKSKLLMNRENLKILKAHGIYSNTLLVYLKYFLKLFQLRA
jgi:glycosyltransferase involved in cell wall biosynthesis